MAKSKDELELEKLVEIDGEYCVPHELNEARHVVDWGPFEPPRSAWYIVHKFLLFLPAMYLFILAVQIMKIGAAAIGPDIQGQFPFANGISTLGFGWLGAYFVLSGSPVAATAISLFGAGTLTKLQTFTMLSGSRLGASFIVLLTGFLYAARNRHDPNRGEPIGMGIQAMTMTALVYLPGMMIGYAIIRSGLLDGINLHASGELDAALSVIWGPVLDLIVDVVPPALLFIVGLLVILGLVQGPRPRPPQGHERIDRQALRVDATALDDVRAGLHRGDADALGVGGADGADPARGEGIRSPRRCAPVHHGREHHDPRRHARRCDAPERSRGGADRARPRRSGSRSCRWRSSRSGTSR